MSGEIYSKLVFRKFATSIIQTLSSSIKKIVSNLKLPSFSSKKWLFRLSRLENILRIISVERKLMSILRISPYSRSSSNAIYLKSKKFAKFSRNNSETPSLNLL